MAMLFSPGRESSPRSRLHGTQGGRVYTARRNFGPRPGSVARALDVHSRASWQVITGPLSDPPSQARPWKPPKYHFFFVFRSAAVSATSAIAAFKSCILCRSHGTTAAIFQAFPPRDSHGQCFLCVSVCVCAIEPRGAYSKQLELGLLQEYNKKSGAIKYRVFVLRCCLRQLCICVPHRAPSPLYPARRGSHSSRTSRSSLCDSHERCPLCVRACACVCAILNTIWTIPTRTSCEFRKHPGAVDKSPTAAVQQQRTSHGLMYT